MVRAFPTPISKLRRSVQYQAVEWPRKIGRLKTADCPQSTGLIGRDRPQLVVRLTHLGDSDSRPGVAVPMFHQGAVGPITVSDITGCPDIVAGQSRDTV